MRGKGCRGRDADTSSFQCTEIDSQATRSAPTVIRNASETPGPLPLLNVAELRIRRGYGLPHVADVKWVLLCLLGSRGSVLFHHLIRVNQSKCGFLPHFVGGSPGKCLADAQ